MKAVVAVSLLALGLGAAGSVQAQNPMQVHDGSDYRGASVYDPASRGFRLDRGCLKGVEAGGVYPTHSYDPHTTERVMANISACTGGYVKGYNETTGARWNMDVFGSGVATGRDEEGHAWRFDPKARLFTNLATNATCARTDLRHVCTVQPN